MAVVFEGRNRLKEKAQALKEERDAWKKTNSILLIIFLCSAVLSLLIYAITRNSFVLVPSAILLLLCYSYFVRGNVNYSEGDIDNLGHIGEQKALNILSELDDNCIIFYSIDIPFDGKISQVDNILVCKHGVFVIEVKNMNSHIIGSYTDRELIQRKVGRRGGEYQSAFYNPIKQVGTQIYRLSNLLRDNDVFTYINGMVFFVNEEVSLDIETDKIPVFNINRSSELFNYIFSFPAALNLNKRNQICNVLKQYL